MFFFLKRTMPVLFLQNFLRSQERPLRIFYYTVLVWLNVVLSRCIVPSKNTLTPAYSSSSDFLTFMKKSSALTLLALSDYSAHCLKLLQKHHYNQGALLLPIAALAIALAPLQPAHATPAESLKTTALSPSKASIHTASFEETATQTIVTETGLESWLSDLPEPLAADDPQPFFATDFIDPSILAVPMEAEWERDGAIAQTPTPTPADVESPEAAPVEVEPTEAETAEAIPVFGADGSERWYVHAGGATTLGGDETSRFGLVGAGASHFFADGHSINLELNSMIFDQPGDDAVGLNLSAILRWHFIRQADWSLYIDGGAGLLGTTNDVPARGSSFNFTPQVGGGTTIRLNDEQRLMVGLRWHHISNGDIYSGNPGLDTIFGYVGLNLPF